MGNNNEWLGNLGMQAGGGIIGSGLGLVMGGINDRRQLKQNEAMLGQQVGAQKQMADYGQGLQKEMWDYTNYGNQVKHMEEAGLNPALMYGKGGGGGTTVGSVSSGVGGGGANRGAEAGMGLQSGLALASANAQIALTNAQTEKVKAETPNVSKQGVILDAEGKLKNVAANVSSATENAQIDKYKTEWAQEINRLEILESENKVAKGTVDNKIKQANQELINSVTANSVMKSGIKLNSAKINEIAESIRQEWSRIDIEGGGLRVKEKTLELMNKGQEFAQTWGVGIDLVKEILGAVKDIYIWKKMPVDLPVKSPIGFNAPR